MGTPFLQKYLRERIFFLVVVLIVALCLPARYASAEGKVTEYHVKAVFLYNLTRFVSWPDENQESRGDFLIGIYGSDPFGELIDKAVAGEKQNGRNIRVERYETAEQARVAGCSILFISSSSMDRFSEIRDALRGRPVLTVADTPGFSQNGGMVNLVEINQKIGLEVNRSVARKAGLFISSKLLSLARVVE